MSSLDDADTSLVTFLDVDGTCHVGGFDAEFTLAIPKGTTLVVMGPNGSGKTTLLRTIAGLVPLDSGHLMVGDTSWDEVDTTTWVPPEKRSVGFVFQDQALFPHLSILDNVAFGLRARGANRHDATDRARGWLERVGLEERSNDRPEALSGGQAQRVALVRALAIDPDVLLLDEPLAALDTTSRAEMRALLTELFDRHQGVRILVTHDPTDAAELAEVTVSAEAGRIVQT